MTPLAAALAALAVSVAGNVVLGMRMWRKRRRRTAWLNSLDADFDLVHREAVRRSEEFIEKFGRPPPVHRLEPLPEYERRESAG